MPANLDSEHYKRNLANFVGEDAEVKSSGSVFK